MRCNGLRVQKLRCESPPCVKAPLMVGPTWTRVRLTLGSDYLPALFQGTALLCLVFLVMFVVCVHMIRRSRWYRVVLVHCICLWAPGGCCYFLLCLLAWCLVSHDRLLCLRLVENVEACICWCSAGFPTILLLTVTVLGLWYFGYWYINIGWCGL